MANALNTTEMEIRKVNQLSQFGTLLAKIGKRVDESYAIKLHLESHSAGERLSPTVQEWQRRLLKHLKSISPPPKVNKTAFQEDPRKLFGAQFDTRVTLRKAGHQGAHEDIFLLQFDPNFASTEVVCRLPLCSSRYNGAAKHGKRDLYLCAQHQQHLRIAICDALTKQNIKIAKRDSKPEPGQFDGYTALISLLEGAYHDAKKFQTLEGKYQAQEAILNVRNFLIITNAVLNPNGNNLEFALPPVVQMLMLLLENSDHVPPLVDALLHALRDVIEMVLFAFGVIYSWVSLSLSSPGSRIGAGVGGVIGGAAGGLIMGPWSGVAGAGAGSILGGLIGSGIYDLVAGDQRAQEMERFRRNWEASGAGANWQPNNQYIVYYFDGNIFGGLYLHPFPAV